MTWKVEVDMFVGRPNPAWSVSQEQVRNLMEIWDGLEPVAPEMATTKHVALGYRGCVLRGVASERWTAVGGAVTRSTAASQADKDRREDPERRFERALLESAPPGLRDTLKHYLDSE